MTVKLQSIGARLPATLITRLERFAGTVSTPQGAPPYTRADALRAAVEEGLRVLESRQPKILNLKSDQLFVITEPAK